MVRTLRIVVFAVFFMAFAALAQTPAAKGTPGATSTNSLLDMVDQLDKLDSLDKRDFLGALDEAETCTRGRRFSCSEAQIAKAAKLVNGSQDQRTLALARQNLVAERRRVDEEIREAERVRVAQAENERRQQEAQARAEAAAEDRQQTSANISGLFSILGTAASNYAVIKGQQQAAAKLGNNIVADSQRAADTARENNERRAREARADTDRRRDAERERSARADAERSAARARAAEQLAAAPQYQPQVVILPKADVVCPPGSTWYNPTSGIGAKGGTCYVNPQAQGQTRVASNSGSGSNAGSGSSSDRPVSASGTTTRPPASGSSGGNTRSDSQAPAPSAKPPPKIQWGPVKLESIAICRQGTKSGKWECNGALDNQTLVDEPTLESALARQHCSGGSYAAGGPVLKGVQWDAYRCNHSLGAGDFDIVKRYGMITAQRSYICPLLGEERCTTFYDGQDKR